jgi:hypothetical protein
MPGKDNRRQGASSKHVAALDNFRIVKCMLHMYCHTMLAKSAKPLIHDSDSPNAGTLLLFRRFSGHNNNCKLCTLFKVKMPRMPGNVDLGH